MACSRCNEERAEGQGFCRGCFEIFPQQSTLRRVLRALGLIGTKLSRGRVGGTLRFGDPGELPDFAREAVERLEDPGRPDTTRVEMRQEFRVSDGRGNERTYASLDEMPPEIRALVQKALKRRR